MRHIALPLVLPTALLGIALASCAAAQEERDGSAQRQTFAYQSSEGEGKSVELRVEDGRVTVAKVDGRPVDPSRVRKVRGGFDILAEDGSVLRHVAFVQNGGMAIARGERREGGMVGGAASGSSSSSSSSSSSGGRSRSESRAGGSVRGNARVEAGTTGIASGEQDGQRSGARSRARIVIGPDEAARGRNSEVEIVEGFPLDAVQGMAAMDGGPAPKSMIGAGLGVPDDALAHHLKIDRRKSTMVTNVIEGLPAQAAGIEQFDIIVSVNGDADASSEHIRKILREIDPGAKIALEILRGSERRKVEVSAVEFDGERLSQLEALDADGILAGPAMVPGMGGAMGGEGGNGVMFFIGPDGQRRELRMPALPGMPAMPQGFDPAQMEQFERAMGDMNRRMEEWGRMMERRMREQGMGGGPDEGDMDGGGVDRGGMDRGGMGIAPAPNAPRPPQIVPPRRGENGPGGGDDRMRRLEERLDQLMRELEKERAERRERKNDA